MAAKESLTRSVSAELAPRGIRVVGLRPQAVPESPTIRDAFEPRAEATAMTWEQWQDFLAAKTHARRLMTLEEPANAARRASSDRAYAVRRTAAVRSPTRAKSRLRAWRSNGGPPHRPHPGEQQLVKKPRTLLAAISLMREAKRRGVEYEDLPEELVAARLWGNVDVTRWGYADPALGKVIVKNPVWQEEV
jgi:hypothetical protein